MQFNLNVWASVALAAAATAAAAEPRPLPQAEVVVRGNLQHPCVNLTRADVAEVKVRIARDAWARLESEKIIQAAEPWLAESDQYWLAFLPKPGAAYAYGFTGCPVCGSPTGTWAAALCSWEKPGYVRCEQQHLLPDRDHPDPGQGYRAPDGRMHYFVGQFNAWVTEQWTTRALPSLAQAYLLTGDERYADRGLLLLDALASIYRESTSGSWDYPSTPPSGRLARPWYQVARTLVQFVDCYDWFYHSPAAEKPSHRPAMCRRRNIEENLLLDGAYYCYRQSWGGSLTNGHADYLRGALAVGCLLDIPEYVDAATKGPFSIDVMLANNIDRDGRYYETAPSYAAWSRQLYLSFAGPLRNLRSREYPQGLNLYDDPRLQATLTLPDLQFQLAGRRPNFGDSAPEPSYLAPPVQLFNASDYLFMERLYAMTGPAARRAEFGAILTHLAANDVGGLRAKQGDNWLLWHGAPPPAQSLQMPSELERRTTGSWVAGVKGVALLRANDQAALLRYGPSLSHGDPDELGLLYYGNGYELSYDIGYGLASTHAQIGWASSTVSHALVTVNEKNQLQGAGSGGSLLGFAALPSVQFTDADSPLSYSSEGVRVYRRSLALVKAGYLVDCFQVEGGDRHDYGFGSLGTALEPVGVRGLQAIPGSLADGFAWGEKLGPDGDIVDQPNKPNWNPPPGNGYGFFFNVRRGKPTGEAWGGTWKITNTTPEAGKIVWGAVMKATSDHATVLRLHILGDPAEPVFADAPGLYPTFPLSSYVMARRRGQNLKSTFLAVYEPQDHNSARPGPRLERSARIGERAVVVHRRDGAVDLLLFGPHRIDSIYGRVEFDGDFVWVTGDGKTPQRAEASGCERLSIGGRLLIDGPAAWTATTTRIDAAARAVACDNRVPARVDTGAVAIFSNPKWTRTSAYHVRRASETQVWLEAATLSLGVGRVKTSEGNQIISDIPHEYSRSMKRSPTRFFEGKALAGRNGGAALITAVKPGSPLNISVKEGASLQEGEIFDYMDLAVGDRIRLALPQVWTARQ